MLQSKAKNVPLFTTSLYRRLGVYVDPGHFFEGPQILMQFAIQLLINDIDDERWSNGNAPTFEHSCWLTTHQFHPHIGTQCVPFFQKQFLSTSFFSHSWFALTSYFVGFYSLFLLNSQFSLLQ